jgi:hypothetical protein
MFPPDLKLEAFGQEVPQHDPLLLFGGALRELGVLPAV